MKSLSLNGEVLLAVHPCGRFLDHCKAIGSRGRGGKDWGNFNVALARQLCGRGVKDFTLFSLWDWTRMNKSLPVCLHLPFLVQSSCLWALTPLSPPCFIFQTGEAVSWSLQTAPEHFPFQNPGGVDLFFHNCSVTPNSLAVLYVLFLLYISLFLPAAFPLPSSAIDGSNTRIEFKQ